jgi:mannose-6-phosphate isomerase-like protein (cupin superfamily)
MMPAVPVDLRPLQEQPVEFVEEVAGIYFRSILLASAGDTVPQHSHDHDHATFVGSGKARVWVDGVWQSDVVAGHAIEIKAGRSHVFQALEPNTRLTCVHDVASAESVKRKGV